MRRNFLISSQDFDAIRSKLRRMPPSSVSLAYDVFVRGLPQGEAAERIGVTKQSASRTLKRVTEVIDDVIPASSVIHKNDDEARRGVLKAQSKTKASRLRPLMPIIDKKVREGVEHQTILDELNRHGFDLNLHTFRTNLYRYRRHIRHSDDGE